MQFKNNIYICISKNDKYLSNTNANNTIIYTQTRTIMKKTFTKKTLVAGIAATLMTLTATNVNAKETF